MTKSKKISKTACTTRKKRKPIDSIWNNNTTEERQRIREFWLQLGDQERRSLVKLEKETVLRKLREQQKHSCSTCGKKRVVIKEESRALYDEELEHYATRQKKGSFNVPCSATWETNKTGNETSTEDCLNHLSNSPYLNLGPVQADRLLEINRQHFLNRMDHFVKENPKEDPGQSHASSDNEGEDPEDTRTERIEKGRRMFELLTTRMFEQRILAAYRDKVAQDRQKKLLEELEQEERLRKERETKKMLEKEKKRNRKRQLKKQQEAQQQLMLESKRKAEEEKTRKQKERKLEEEKKRQERERLKKEQEKKQKEQERARKEEEQRLRQAEEKKMEEKKAREERKEKEAKRKQEQQDRNTTQSSTAENRQQLLMDALIGSSSPTEPSLFSAPYLHYPYNTLSHSHHSPYLPTSRQLNPPSFLYHSPSPPCPYPERSHRPAEKPVRRPATSIAPIGQPITPPSLHSPVKGSTPSFFSNFLFGEPQTKPALNTCLLDPNRSQPNLPQGTTTERKLQKNEWTAFSLLSDPAQGRFFKVLPDRTCVLLERAKAAYQKLTVLALSKTHYHTLVQLYGLMNDLYLDLDLDLSELHQILCASHEFRCVPFGHDIVVYLCTDPNPSLLLCNEFINTH